MVILVVAVVLIFAAFIAYRSDQRVISPDTLVGYKNTTYTIEGQSVTLTGGVSTSEAEQTKYVGYEKVADFTGEGIPDVTFVLTSASSGSGTFYYIAFAEGSDAGFVGKNTLFVGDRIVPVSINSTSDQIVITYLDRMPSEPMTSIPNVPMKKYFKVVNGLLVESLAPAPIAPSPVPVSGCYVGGCSSQICSDQKDMASTCEYNETYACYKTATCERQVSGECGWTSSPELLSCLGQ